MLSGLFPLIYTAGLAFLLLQAFRMMSMATSVPAPARQLQDRTGLQTVHPELLDENGNVTDEEVWIVRFSDQDGFATSQS